jgi:hypothetical protein
MSNGGATSGFVAGRAFPTVPASGIARFRTFLRENERAARTALRL